MSWQGLAKNDQKCKFRAKFGRFWAKYPNFLLEKAKVMVHTEGKNHLATLFALFFGQA